MKKLLVVLALSMLLLNASSAFADAGHQSGIEEGKNLVESNVPCDNLSDEQLEAIGEYFMEQMHPGEAHEMMDKMMGGEGSESLRQVHITMAKRLYCNEDISGMMGSGGMMGWKNPQTNMVQGMMGNWYGPAYWPFANIPYIILLIGAIILVYSLATKSSNDSIRKKSKKHGKRNK